MKFDKNNLNQKWVYYPIATCSAVVLYLALSNIGIVFSVAGKFFHVISPILMGAVIAYVLNPIASWFQENILKGISNEKNKNNISVLLTIVTVFLALFILVYKLVPQIVESLSTLINNMRTYMYTINKLLDHLEELAANAQIDISFLTNMGTNMLHSLTSALPNTLNDILSTSYSIGMNVFNILVGFILAVYFLLDKKRMIRAIQDFLRLFIPENELRSSVNFWQRCNAILMQYIGCSIVEAILVGVVNGIFMTMVGMPYVVLISVVVGVTNLAPTFGPIIGAIIGGVILVLVSPWYCVWFLLFTLVLQTIDGYIVKPKLFGGGLGVPGVWILITIIIGGRMLGVIGILLAIPIAAILDFVYHDLVRMRLGEETIEEEAESGSQSGKKAMKKVRRPKALLSGLFRRKERNTVKEGSESDEGAPAKLNPERAMNADAEKQQSAADQDEEAEMQSAADQDSEEEMQSAADQDTEAKKQAAADRDAEGQQSAAD